MFNAAQLILNGCKPDKRRADINKNPYLRAADYKGIKLRIPINNMLIVRAAGYKGNKCIYNMVGRPKWM